MCYFLQIMVFLHKFLLWLEEWRIFIQMAFRGMLETCLCCCHIHIQMNFRIILKNA